MMYSIVSLLVSIFSAISASNPAAGLFMYYWLYFNGFFSNPVPTNPVADVVSVIEDADSTPAANERQTQPEQDTSVADEPQTAPETTQPSPEGNDTTPEAPAGIGFDANPGLTDEEKIVFNDINNLREGIGLGQLKISSYIQSNIRKRLADCEAANFHTHKYDVFPGGFREVAAEGPINDIADLWWNASSEHRLVVRDQYNVGGLDPTNRFIGVAVKRTGNNIYCAYAIISNWESP